MPEKMDFCVAGAWIDGCNHKLANRPIDALASAIVTISKFSRLNIVSRKFGVQFA